MGIRLLKGGQAALKVENNLAVEAGTPVEIDGVVCIQGVDSGSAKSTRNAWYPTDTVVFEADKAAATDFSGDDAEINYDTATKLAVTTAVGGTVVKVGRKFPGNDKQGEVNDTKVRFVHTLR